MARLRETTDERHDVPLKDQSLEEDLDGEEGGSRMGSAEPDVLEDDRQLAGRAAASLAESEVVILKRMEADDESLDAVRSYYRQVRAVPLLTHEEEIVLAKRMERGRWLVPKALSRSPICVEALLEVEEQLKHKAVDVRDIIDTTGRHARRRAEVMATLDQIKQLYEKALGQSEKVQALPKRSPEWKRWLRPWQT